MAGDQHETVKEILDCSVRDIQIGKSSYKVENVMYNGTKEIYNPFQYRYDSYDFTRREITVTSKDGNKMGIRFVKSAGEPKQVRDEIQFLSNNKVVGQMYHDEYSRKEVISSSIRKVPDIILTKELFDKPKQESFETSSPEKPFNFMNTNDLLYDMEHTFHDSKQARDLANFLKTFVVVTPEERSSYKAYATSINAYKEDNARQAEEARRRKEEAERKMKDYWRQKAKEQHEADVKSGVEAARKLADKLEARRVKDERRAAKKKTDDENKKRRQEGKKNMKARAERDKAYSAQFSKRRFDSWFRW